jgi:hypothetical protein
MFIGRVFLRSPFFQLPRESEHLDTPVSTRSKHRA